jgi:hypothetical protein
MKLVPVIHSESNAITGTELGWNGVPPSGEHICSQCVLHNFAYRTYFAVYNIANTDLLILHVDINVSYKRYRATNTGQL